MTRKQRLKSIQTYGYVKKVSIITYYGKEAKISLEEEWLMFKFFVVHNPCGDNMTWKSISFKDYGWPDKIDKPNGLRSKLDEVLSISSNQFVFTEKDDLKEKFAATNLTDGFPEDIITERAVIGDTPGDNKHLKLFRHIRNCFCHGKYVVVKNALGHEMIIMQDNYNKNVTARIVIRKTTLMEWIRIIDKNKMITQNSIENH